MINKFKVLFSFLSLLLLLSFIGTPLFSQQKHWVFLKDKKGVEFDPLQYFDHKAIERRTNQGIPLDDISDYPLNVNYVNIIEHISLSVIQKSRWFNAIVVYADSEQLAQIIELPFVKEIRSVNNKSEICLQSTSNPIYGHEKGFMRRQINRMEGNIFQENNIDGKGIRIAVFDIGFKNVDIHPAFAHLRKNGQIKKTWDFVSKKENVYHYNIHGTMVLSCITGIVDSTAMGLATASEFLLARTEKNSELFLEEENWLAAAEWADKNGADIINSSLAYTYQRYFSDEMDGNTSLVSQAAKMAARKGILVVNAAGNEGSGDWYYIATPADADSVLAVGGISPDSDIHSSFSSFGPTSDKRMKPNVCAFGTAIVANKKGVSFADGTSFSSPLIAGFAACAWQKNRQLNNMELFAHIENAGDLYPYFDYAHGYGVPQASYFISMEKEVTDSTFTFIEKENILKVLINKEFLNEDKLDYDLLYYNVMNTNGVLEKYAILEVEQREILELNTEIYEPGTKINVFYRKYQGSFTIK